MGRHSSKGTKTASFIKPGCLDPASTPLKKGWVRDYGVDLEKVCKLPTTYGKAGEINPIKA
jgi:hypothetical protein